MRRGDIVWIWFDTGAGKMGSAQMLYGRVVDAGPRSYRVRWESGLTNRFIRDGRRAEPQLVQGDDAIAEATSILARYQAS